ncbi:ABC transporter permease [Roseateles sp.]|uniref:ABC transporter permease n=1 Tax=Roseateles sp. TaxID=1971397 RepID=UPI002F3EFF07
MSADPDLIARAVSSLGPVLPEQPATTVRRPSGGRADRQTTGGATRAQSARQWPMWLLGALPPIAVLALAEAAVRSGWIAPNLLPAPSDVAAALAQMLRDGQLTQHVLASTLRVAGGFALGAVLAVLFGALVGLSGLAAAVLTPSFQALRAIPSLAWVPLLLLWLGIDEASKIALIAIGAFFPVYMGVSSGFRDVDRKLVEVARLRGLGRVALARRVLLPAALPALLTGLRNGLSLAWMFMVAAELIAASRGLGYLLTDGRETGRADLVMAAIVLLALLGKLTDSLMAAVEQRALHWRDSFGGHA